MVNPGQAPGQAQVIWSRPIDEDALSRRWRKLGLYYGAPSAVALVLALVLGGVGAFLGVLILAGLVGLLLVAFVFFKNFNARANRTIELDDGHLVLGKRRVEVARIESWSTRTQKEDWGSAHSMAQGNVMAGNAITATAAFRLTVHDESGQRGVRPDGGPAFEIVGFAWAEMDPQQLDGVRTALTPHIPAPWVPPGDLRD